MNKRFLGFLGSSGIVLATFTGTAQADMTVQQNTTLDVASIVKMHGSTTTSLTTDKKREDTEGHCEGVMSIVCGNVQSGEIVRLDRDLTWHLEPKKKKYLEQPFATPEQLAAMRAKMQANLDKMRSCPVSEKQQPIDKSKCEMSPLKFDSHKTDDRLSIAGHDAQRTTATMTETCTNKDTGDVCDTIVAVDVWLTQDKLPGAGDRTAFESAYAKKLGLADVAGVMKGEAAKFLAPYQDQIKKLSDKSADFKGQPLKTSFRVIMGGKQCSSAKAKSGGDSSPTDAVNPLANAAQAGKALTGLVGGLFKKKKPDDSTDAAPAAGGAPSAPDASKIPDEYAQSYTQLAFFSSETVSVSAEPVPAGRFDVPADWTKETPKTAKEEQDYTCPKT